MTASESAFWTTAAQLTVVLALALVVDLRSVFGNARSMDAGWRSFKFASVVQVISATLSIALAFKTCLQVLSSGNSTPAQINSVSWELVTAFSFLVVGGALEVVVRILVQPANQNNPEPRRQKKVSPVPSSPPAEAVEGNPPAPEHKAL